MSKQILGRRECERVSTNHSSANSFRKYSAHFCVSLVFFELLDFFNIYFFDFFLVFFRVSFDYVLRLLLCDSFVIFLGFVSKLCVHCFFCIVVCGIWLLHVDICSLAY